MMPRVMLMLRGEERASYRQKKNTPVKAGVSGKRLLDGTIL
jgi:hypothetical protein